jgi:anti-sigma B factor antagonist
MGNSSVHAVSFDLDGTLYDYDRHRVHLLPSLLRHPRVLLAYKDAVTALRGQRSPNLRAERGTDAKDDLEPQVLEVLRVDGKPVFRLGSSDIASREQLLAALDFGAQSVVIDCSDITLMDSNGFGFLIACLKKTRETGASLVLRKPNPQMLLVLEMTGTDGIFVIDQVS